MRELSGSVPRDREVLKVLVRRLAAFLFLVMLLGCTAQQASGSLSSTPTAATATPNPNAAFSGPLDAAPGVSGTISFVISETGHIAEMRVEGSITIDCGGGDTKILTVATRVFPEPIAIEGGRFSISRDDLDWDGAFDSATSVRGNIRLSGGTDCQNRPPSVTWSATSEGS